MQSSISKARKNGVLVTLLSESSEKETLRKITMDSNDIFLNELNGIEISSESFSAHNIAVGLKENKIVSNKKEGLLLSQIAITSLNVFGCELSHNFGSAAWFQSVHHKSNKCERLVLKDSKFVTSKTGFGLYVYDSGLTALDCIFNDNKEGGIYLQGSD
jgi:hypothetical protein